MFSNLKIYTRKTVVIRNLDHVSKIVSAKIVIYFDNLLHVCLEIRVCTYYLTHGKRYTIAVSGIGLWLIVDSIGGHVHGGIGSGSGSGCVGRGLVASVSGLGCNGGVLVASGSGWRASGGP